MNNYEYIVASLPVITSDFRGDLDYAGVIAEIRSQLSKKDEAILDTLLDGFDADKLDAEFYRKALSSPDKFIRDYFTYDLDVRNTRVEFLNKALGRPEGMDIMVLDEEAEPVEFEGRRQVMSVLEGSDILERERGLDNLMWEKIDEIVGLQVFTLDAILGFAAKLQIIARWLKLDPETGRELFRKLVDEIRNNKNSINNEYNR
ncbi:MAG: DUF2764 family protein [Bacteroidales bacterium]|nr:DUF2764 family protein [Bacteroidales bacterium]